MLKQKENPELKTWRWSAGRRCGVVVDVDTLSALDRVYKLDIHGDIDLTRVEDCPLIKKPIAVEHRAR